MEAGKFKLNVSSTTALHMGLLLLLGGLCGLWTSACGTAQGMTPPAQSVWPANALPPVASHTAAPKPQVIASGPDGWWLFAQRLPQSDFGPGFAYFLAPADLETDAVSQLLEHSVPIPHDWCLATQKIQFVRLSLTGGRVAIFCALETKHFWIWDLARTEFYSVTITEKLPQGQEAALRWFAENPLWSRDGQEMFLEVEGGALVVLDVPQGQVRTKRPISGIPLAWDPQGRYLAESVYDETVAAPDGSPKQYNISHLYLLDWSTGAEERLEIPPEVQRFLPPEEQCWFADHEHAMGWEPQLGDKFFFTVECGHRWNADSLREYVFLADRTFVHAQLLWQSTKPQYITALWEPHGRGLLLQIADMNGEGASQGGGEMIFVNDQGQVIREWRGFPTSTLRIVGWGVP